jgi:LmbE family N-acetylglucosaminyl deacetylase
MQPLDAAALGRTLAVVPHPDDETLGCGGLLALLAANGLPVRVVLVSDGALSHPGSLEYPAPRLRALRSRELVDALCALGLGAQHLVSMGLPDGAVPALGEPGFDVSVTRLERLVATFRPQTVLLPWRRDPHPDHRAAHALGTAACNTAAPGARRLEYPVWAAQRGEAADHPLAQEAAAWQIDISSVTARKQRALAAHRSQLGLVVRDDPQGFKLPPEMVARCATPNETYFELLERRR